MDNKPLISVKNSFIIAFIILISFVAISQFLINDLVARTFFGDIAAPIIEIFVISTLIYATIRSKPQGLRVQLAWMLITVAFSVYAIGDTIWAIIELGFNQNPFISVTDLFYLTFYPLFALGIYYLTRFTFTRTEKLKIFIEMGIVIITVGLILWTFLVIPALSSQENIFSIAVSLIYILGDILLLFVLLRLLYSKLGDNVGSAVLLGLGIFVMICTDIVFAYQNLHNTYISGGLLDTGWILSFILVGLAGFLQATQEEFRLDRLSKIRLWIERSNSGSYLPLIWVLIAFILLAWSNENLSITNSELTELAVGFIIFLVIVRQVITLNENKKLFSAAEKEIKNRRKAEEIATKNELYYKTIFENTGTAIILIEEDTKISRVNSEVERLTGFKREEIEGRKKWTDFIVDTDLKRFEGYNARNNLETQPREYETQAVDKSGNIKDLLMTVVPIPGLNNSWHQF